MRYRILFIFFISLGFFSCKNDTSEEVSNEIIPEDPYVVPSDSIPERTSASALNLDEYQLFIDTTRTSSHYKDLDSIINSERKAYKDALFKMVEIKKYKDSFLLYQPCEDQILRVYISKSDISLNSNSIKESYKLKDFMLESGSQVLFKDIDGASLSLKEINAEILQLKYDKLDDPIYLTSIKNIKHFEMMINNCLGKKVREFDKFQE